jgi:hypothetical protein
MLARELPEKFLRLTENVREALSFAFVELIPV